MLPFGEREPRDIINSILSEASSRIDDDGPSSIPELLATIHTTLPEMIEDIAAKEAPEWIHVNLNVLSASMWVPARAPQLRGGFETLTRFLSEPVQDYTAVHSQTRAYLLAKMFLQEAPLPAGQKKGGFDEGGKGFGSVLRMVEKTVPQGEATDEFRRLEEATAEFENHLDALAQPNADEERTKMQLTYLDSFSHTMDELIYDLGRVVLSQNTLNTHIQRYTTLVESAAANPLVKRQLLNHEMDDSHKVIKTSIFLYLIMEGYDELEFPQVVQFYISDPTLQGEFLRNGAKFSGNTISDEHRTQDTDTVYRHVQKLGEESLLLYRCFQNNAVNIEEVFQTFPYSGFDQEEQLRQIRRVLGTVAYLRRVFPDHPDSPRIPELMEAIAERSNLAVEISPQLAILQNQEPGILVLDARFEAKPRPLSPTMSREEFLQQQLRTHTPIVYVSQARAPHETRKVVVQKPEELELRSAGFHLDSKEWGILLIPTESRRVMEWLSRRFGGNPDVALGLWDKEASTPVKRMGQFPILMPDVLPTGHRFSSLQKAGILAIEQRDDQAGIVIDPKRAGIHTEDMQRITLIGEVNKSGELMIPGGDEELQLTPLLLTVNAAVLWARRSFIQKSIPPPDERRMQIFISDWNKKAKEQQVPRLGYPGIKGPLSGQPVITTVGNDPVLLQIP